MGIPDYTKKKLQSAQASQLLGGEEGEQNQNLRNQVEI